MLMQIGCSIRTSYAVKRCLLNLPTNTRHPRQASFRKPVFRTAKQQNLVPDKKTGTSVRAGGQWFFLTPRTFRCEDSSPKFPIYFLSKLITHCSIIIVFVQYLSPIFLPNHANIAKKRKKDGNIGRKGSLARIVYKKQTPEFPILLTPIGGPPSHEQMPVKPTNSTKSLKFHTPQRRREG